MSYLLTEKDIQNIIENGFNPDDYVMQTCILGWSLQDMMATYNKSIVAEDNENLVYDKDKLDHIHEILDRVDVEITGTDFGDTYETLLGYFRLHAQKEFSKEELEKLVTLADKPKELSNNDDIINKVFKTSAKIKNVRRPQSVTMQLVSEVGKLAEEIRVDTDPTFYKESGPDGVLGESVDILIATLDLLYLYGYTDKQIHETLDKKLSKWEKKATENK